MYLQEAILQVAQKPTSIKARVFLASSYQQFDAVNAAKIWEAAVRVAASKGEFFHALALCRLHLPGEQQTQFLKEVLHHAFSPQEKLGMQAPIYPKPKRLQLPSDGKALIQMALQVGADLQGFSLPKPYQLPEIPIFGDLPEDLYLLMLQTLAPVPLRVGDTLIKQGAKERSCYLVTHGRLRITQLRPDGREIELARVAAPTLMGEIALLTNISRRATVTTESSTMAWRIDSNLLTRLTEKHPSLMPQIRTLIRVRLLSNLIRMNKFFADMDEETRLHFLQAFSMQTVEPESYVIQQGLPTTGLFVLMHGDAAVLVKGAAGRNSKLADLTEGDFFGASSFFSSQPSKTTVYMPEGGLILRLTPQSVRSLRSQSPALEQKLLALASQQY